MLNLDMIAVLVPATWNISGATSIPVTRNKGCAEGRLEPVPVDVGELVTAGMKLPGSLFEAEGTNDAGGHVGVRVGIYDAGGPNPVALVQEAVARLAPKTVVSPTHLVTGKALRTLQRWDDDPVRGGSVICDYWVGMKERMNKEPTSSSCSGCGGLGRRDRMRRSRSDVAGSFVVGGGASFAGPLRPTSVGTYGPPPTSEVVEPGRFRYAGWRLGKVLHSKMISEQRAELATEGGVRPRDGLLVLAVFFAWMITTLSLIGVGGEVLLGGMTMVGTLPLLHKHGLKAVIGLVVSLGALLALGVATS